MSSNVSCPLCNGPLGLDDSVNDEIVLVTHVMKAHHNLAPKDIHRLFEIGGHLLDVLRKDCDLDPSLERFVLKNAGDHSRHAVELSRSRGVDTVGVLNAGIGKAPRSDYTFATKKKPKK